MSRGIWIRTKVTDDQEITLHGEMCSYKRNRLRC